VADALRANKLRQGTKPMKTITTNPQARIHKPKTQTPLRTPTDLTRSATKDHAVARNAIFGDLDYHLIRASLVIIFLFFGYQKWFQYEAQALLPYISNGPLLFWMYPVFGIRGATYFLGVAEWLFGGLLFLGFWNKKLGILGALGACFSFIATFTIIPFMPDGWAVSAGGFPAMTEKVAFLMKDLVLFAASFYLVKQDVARVALSREGSGEFQKRAFLKTSHGRV
jgi:uncharacterized membrane protein YkgB